MLALMLLEKPNAVEIIFGLAITVIFIINLVVGFSKRNETADEEGTKDEEMLLGAEMSRQASLVDSNINVPPDQKAKILKEKDPKSLQKAK